MVFHSVNCLAGIEVTSDAFDKLIGRPNQYTLVMFYAPWCPHCQTSKPKYLEAAKQIEKLDSTKSLAMVDCDNQKNTELCQAHSIESYPTIKLYFEGKLVQEYENEVNEKKITDFMKTPPKPDGQPTLAAIDINSKVTSPSK
ncbi:unnamed protein product [Protopolystoma xenopodis]|uniref:Thioredoxin domain-containing protein n=1 Tax=Protopolystoma xenopodis TaxID=117903 RepID=A0A448XC47_9PLAT|nr:unnamed protein product [Protopolystoma xenopodis]